MFGVSIKSLDGNGKKVLSLYFDDKKINIIFLGGYQIINQVRLNISYYYGNDSSNYTYLNNLL